MKKTTALLLSIAFILMACNNIQQSQETIKIAALLPLTGKESAQGEWAKRGLELALERVNQETSHYKFEIIYGDTQTNPKETVNAYNNLINSNQVDFILTLGSPFAMVLSPLANISQQILLSIASAPAYSSQDDFTFRITPSATKDGEVVSSALTKQLGIHDVAIIYQNNDYGLGVKKTFQETFEKAGGQISIGEFFEPNDFDFKTQILKVKDKNPTAVFLASWGKQAGRLIKQSHELGFRPQFICGAACENIDFFKEASLAGNGALITSLPINHQSKFYQSYKNNHNENPTFVPERMYYSILIIKKLKDWCGDNKQCYLEKLYSQEFDVSSGKVTFDEYGDISDSYKIYKVQDGGLVETFSQASN